MPIYEYKGNRPIIAKSSFIHPQAVIIGDVKIGDNCYIGAYSILRGDYGNIVIGNKTNVQEGSIIHTEPTTSALIGNNVVIGHAAIVHGPCTINDEAAIGMGAIICNGCTLEFGSMLAAGSLLAPGKIIPEKKLAMGNPAQVVKEVTDNMAIHNKAAVNIYHDLAACCQTELKLIKE
ncbi:hypothetical protein SYNTR_0475 [Candidatus Syntrophocurvum alkaliphilum]|uniref:Carbonic anhydrase n=1 Tax=Candidatus Syntrophocurvum alkaliphilum TaxID=2293317 RepID=A0A6I6DEY2_9FIRM|nr:gamma carbonic anhydrase family protein [Candidatus Syntrophocurvum alkaliphilum]QGT99068.1 hypothetical protein SYNTR_0475 [Candidatus Syntrophocurvum alkaliphilum]